MSQTRVVAGLAVRELWMSFRLIVILAAYLGAGVLVALVPAAPSAVLLRLAIGLAIAAVAGAATAAWSLSHERQLGRVGWLAARSIERRTIIGGWFVALAALTTAGTLGAGLLGWAAAGGPVARLDAAAFALLIAGIACGGYALLAGGLALGSVLQPRLATAAALATGGAAVTLTWVATPTVALPAEALSMLARLDRPISVALQGAGVSLAAAVALLVLAAVALGRVDL